MKPSRPGVRPRLIGLGLTLLLTALIGAACAPAAPSAPPPGVAPTQAVAPTTIATNAPAPAAPKAGPVVPIAPTALPAKVANLPVGVDADGNFYRGNPNAPVKLIEFSDYQ